MCLPSNGVPKLNFQLLYCTNTESFVFRKCKIFKFDEKWLNNPAYLQPMLPTTLYTYAFHRSRTLEEWIDCAQGTEAEGIKLALTWQSRVLLSILAPLAQNWTEWQKNPPEIRFLKIREIDNSLKLFECVEHAVTGNGSYATLQIFALKNSWNHFVNSFSARFRQFKIFWMCRTRNDRKRKLCDFSQTCMEKLVKSLWVNSFSASFSLA